MRLLVFLRLERLEGSPLVGFAESISKSELVDGLLGPLGSLSWHSFGTEELD